jgi:hypothetical protein
MYQGLAAAAVVAVLALGATASCGIENRNDVTCVPTDCGSACEALGYAGGACADDECTCGPADSDTYTWDGGADAAAGRSPP